MDTRFELNIKKFSIKGDAKALYLYINGNLLLKFSYRDIETAVRFLLEKLKCHSFLIMKESSLCWTTLKKSEKEEGSLSMQRLFLFYIRKAPRSARLTSF